MSNLAFLRNWIGHSSSAHLWPFPRDRKQIEKKTSVVIFYI
jgi:hypothetical protein